MITIKRDEDKIMDVHMEGNAEDIANEYAALTYWLKSNHRPIYDRAMYALEHHNIETL